MKRLLTLLTFFFLTTFPSKIHADGGCVLSLIVYSAAWRAGYDVWVIHPAGDAYHIPNGFGGGTPIGQDDLVYAYTPVCQGVAYNWAYTIKTKCDGTLDTPRLVAMPPNTTEEEYFTYFAENCPNVCDGFITQYHVVFGCAP